VKHQRLMTLLPALPEKPETLPIPLEEVLEHVEDSLSGADWRGADALLQFLDCRNIEDVLLERDRFDVRAPRSREHIDAVVELPGYMQEFIETWRAGSMSGNYPMQELWRGYYRNLFQTAHSIGSKFLEEWATWDVSLRNLLAETRAEAAGLDSEEHMMERPHGDPNHEDLLMRLREASDPMARQRYLDEARLETIEMLRGTDPFSLDTVLAYLSACLILERWDLPEAPDTQALLEEMG